MGFLDHLDELRRRLIWSLVALGAAFAVALSWTRRILAFFLRPITPLLGDHKPIFTDLTEPFLLYMKVAFVASIFLAAPFILYQIWAFISPGLYARERRYAVPFILFATSFFLLGIAGDFQPALRISGLFSFESKIILGMGLVFELPTVVYFLARLGLITPGFLWRNFKYAILIIFIVAAVVTPTPDMVTQCIFAAPMILLYLLSILVAHVFGRHREARPGKQGT